MQPEAVPSDLETLQGTSDLPTSRTNAWWRRLLSGSLEGDSTSKAEGEEPERGGKRCAGEQEGDSA